MKKLRFPKFLFISIALLTSLFIQAQKVGIGTTAPSAGLEIVTDGNNLNALRVATNQAYNASPDVPDVGIGFRFKYNTAGTYTSGAVISAIKENDTDGNQSGILRFMTNSDGTIAERMRITSGGNVGIGTTSITTGTRLEVAGNISIKSGADAYVQTTDGNNLILRADQPTGTSGKGLRFQYWNGAGWKNALNFDNVTSSGYTNLIMQSDGGNVGIGTTSPTYPLHVNGSVGATSYVTTSDARLKNVLQNWASGDHIDFVQFRWKNGNDNREHYGYLAQEVQQILPDAVQTDNKGMMSVNYDEVHSYKLAMQEKRIKELEQTIEELKKVIKRKRFRRKA